MRTKLILFAGVILAGFAASITLPVAKTSAKNDKLRRSERPIPNRYIVVLNDTDENGSETLASERAAEHARGFSMRVEKVFEFAIKGYSAEMSDSEASRLAEDAGVKFVEEDTVVEVRETQTGATWNLDRIDQRSLPFSTTYSFNSTGLGVHVYVMDTGILTNHVEFGGRADSVYDAFRDGKSISECHGHGTHVAGIVGSSTYGVAKQASLHSVRVLDCQGYGSASGVAAGLDWVTRNAARPAVVNMSLGSAKSSAVDSAVDAAVRSGITVVVAAGNETTDACNLSPSGAVSAITVGATNHRDERVSYSNYGRCVDIFAPGQSIQAPYNTSDTAVVSISGTSTASPHVAGAAALYLQQNPAASPADVQNAILTVGTPDSIVDPGPGSPNLLLYSLLNTSGEPPSPPPPPAPDPDLCTGLKYAGNLSSGGAVNYQSSMNGFSGGSGTYSGRLRVPAGMTFVLSLDQKKGKSWATVANSAGTSDTEVVSFKGKSGTYRWRIRSVYGGGDYHLCSVTP